MLIDNMLCAIDDARPAELANVGSDISRAYANGHISEDHHQILWEAIEARRAKKNAPRASARPRRPMSPETERKIRQRRKLAYSGPMRADEKAQDFTVAEYAVALIVGDDNRKYGQCDDSNRELAARSGTSPSTVKRAKRKMKKHILAAMEERRPERGSGQRSQPTIIRVISTDWWKWLRRGGGGQQRSTIDTSARKRLSEGRPADGFGRQWRAHYRHYDPNDPG